MYIYYYDSFDHKRHLSLELESLNVKIYCFTPFLERRNGRSSSRSWFQSAENWKPTVPWKDWRKKSRPSETQTHGWKCATDSQHLQGQ